MQTPLLRTKQGFELQIGTNHFGHFKLNAALFDVLEASGARVVPVASVAHEMGKIDLADLDYERRAYDPTEAYCQSKLANVMYGFELQRRLAARGSRVVAIPCHPGYAATNLQSAGVGMEGGSKLFRMIYAVTNVVLAQSATAGAYYGPTGLMRARGPVRECWVAPRAQDEAVAKGLWEATEARVGAFFAGPA